MRRTRFTRIAAVIVLACATLAACNSPTNSTAKKKHYSQVYQGGDGVYAHCYDSSTQTMIWYLLFVNNSVYAPTSTTVTASTISSGSWRPAPTPPAASSLQDTKLSVPQDEQGEPTEEAVPQDEVPQDAEVMTEDTTPQDAQVDQGDGGSDNNGDGSNGGDGSDGGDAGGGGDGS